VFTEYKTTLDYLQRRLTSHYKDSDAIQVLFGNMDPPTLRDDIKKAFNDPASLVRVLVATDAASEGLNLQETARYLLHFDVPWNPSRLEQRNGRLDRHGQARDVFVFHFASDNEADLRFLAYVVQKVDAIREDLGSVGEVFDAAFQRRFIEARDETEVRESLERTVEATKGRADLPRDANTGIDHDPEGEYERLKALAAELDLNPDTLRTTLDVALRIGSPVPNAIDGPENDGRYRLKTGLPSEWQAIVDTTVRIPEKSGRLGPLPAVVFDPAFFIDVRSGRPVFRPRRDTALLHLGHPLFQRALASFARSRFAGARAGASRWTVRRGDVASGASGVVLLTVEELAVNELRESFHHWVRTVCLPIRNGGLDKPLPHATGEMLTRSSEPAEAIDRRAARELWMEVSREIRDVIRNLALDLESRIVEALKIEQRQAVSREEGRFKSRQGELSTLIEEQSLAKLEAEIRELEIERRQGQLFDEEARLADLISSQKEKEEELQRRRTHYELLRQQLSRERVRVMEHLLPHRYALRGHVQVFPVAVEVRMPRREAR
jgi:hypothetical protein